MHLITNQINIIIAIDKFIDETIHLCDILKESNAHITYIEYLELVVTIFRNLRINLVRCSDGIDRYQYKNILNYCKDLNDIQFKVSFLKKFNRMIESFATKNLNLFLFFFSNYNFQTENICSLDQLNYTIKYYLKIIRFFDYINDLSDDSDIRKLKIINIATCEKMNIYNKYKTIKRKIKKYF